MKFDRCPNTQKTENMDVWLIAYKMFKNGFLPVKDGWFLQTNKYIEVMTFIDEEVTRHQNEMAVKNGKR